MAHGNVCANDLKSTWNSFSTLLRSARSYCLTNYFNDVFECTYPSKNAFILSLLCVVDIPTQKLVFRKQRTQRALFAYSPDNQSFSCKPYVSIIPAQPSSNSWTNCESYTNPCIAPNIDALFSWCPNFSGNFFRMHRNHHLCLVFGKTI